MDFYISIALSDQFKVDKTLVGRYEAGAYGDCTGLTLDTSIADFADNQLTIVTEMALVGHNDTIGNIAQCRFLTKFHFENTAILNSGVTTRAVTCLHECIDLAQAHAYGLFCYHSRNNDLPILESQVQPLEQMQVAITAFLTHFKK